MPPKLTVIIAAYNWSSALLCSIPSVLYQTFRDFELLVIGDACTDDSEAAVASFHDPRVSWHNLPERIGSQSGPNNFGLRIGRGEYIAYLGHDDIWHPDHLRSLLAAIEREQGDLACSISVMYGPPGSGVRGLSGVFVEDKYRPTDFFPPSAMMHRRNFLEWNLPGSVPLPVDCDFLQRARAANAKIVSSRRLTAFKFNAAWRRDSYRRRDTSEQEAMLQRLREDPASCAEAELASLLQAAREKRLIETQMPGDCPGIYHGYLRYRGLEAPPASDFTSGRRFLPDDPSFAGLEWHTPEVIPEWGVVRWSGPALEATMTLPVIPPARFQLRIQILNWFEVPFEQELRLFVNDEPVTYLIDGRQLLVEPCESTGDAVRVRFAVTRMRCPHFEWPGKTEDYRWMGICLNWMEMEEVKTPSSSLAPSSLPQTSASH